MLFDPIRLGNLELPNRIVMAPMTRCRAGQPGDVPTAMMAEYYGQRASAGLIVSEGTPVSPTAPGYLWTPGLYSEAQVVGWRQVTEAVHGKGGRIFAQLWHCGRVSHHTLQPNGAAPPAPSAVQAATESFAHDADGNPARVAADPPRAMTTAEIRETVDDFRCAAANATAGGFDGVEIHSANGYLLDQFLNVNSNRRDDQYGGALENRARFVLEVVEAVAAAVGADKVGIRLSPHGTFNDMGEDPEADAMTRYLAARLGELGIAYIHFVDPAFNGYAHGDILLRQAREAFGRPVIACGAMTAEKAERYLGDGRADLIGFGRAYIANPDLPERLERGVPLAEADPDTFYGGGAAGYTDYPSYD